MTVGVTPTGFIRPTTEEILSDLADRLRAARGVAVRTDARSRYGQIIGVVAGGLDLVWQAAQAAYYALDRRSATGAALDAIGALFDTTRKPATYSSGTVVLTGDVGAAPQAGDVVTSSDALLRYQLVSTPAALSAATARAPSTAVATGALRSNSGNVYVALAGGTTGGGIGPTGTDAYPATQADGTVTWAFVGEGLALTSGVAILATVSGPVGGTAFGLDTIGTPRTGWKGVANLEDVAAGRDVEPDEEYRVRQLVDLFGFAKATLNAIRAALLRRVDVTEAYVFENVEQTTDADGIPPHAVEAVWDGSATNEAVAGTLFDSVAAGIKTWGTTTVQVADSHGFLHPVRHTLPEEIDVYALVTVTADRNAWPADGTDRVEAAVLAYGASLKIGTNVRHSAVSGAVWAAGIPGVLGVSTQLDTVAITTQPPADVVVSLREIGRLDSARTEVVVSYEDP